MKEVSSSDDLRPTIPGKAPPPNAIHQHVELTTTYPVVTLDRPIANSVFTFTPPPGAILVESFANPSGIPPRTTKSEISSTPAKLPEMVGRMEPSATYYAADGTPFQLKSLRGHPVLVDLWATTCGPCILEMPAIDDIYERTKRAGLVMVAPDMDDDASDAAKFMKKKGYGWANYHVRDGLGFPNTGVPLVALIDENGRFVYYHNGAEELPGLLEAIKRLGPVYGAALADKK